MNARESIRGSQTHHLIQSNFKQLSGALTALDDGETIKRFEDLV